MNLIPDLEFRGLVYQATDADGLAAPENYVDFKARVMSSQILLMSSERTTSTLQKVRRRARARRRTF